MPSETIVAVFDTPAHAQLAVSDLERAGIPTSSVEQFSETAETGTDRSGPVQTSQARPHGFWSWLAAEGGEHPTAQHEYLDRSMASGHTVVTVVTDTTRADEVVSMLETHAPLGLDHHDDGAAPAGDVMPAAPPHATQTAPAASGGEQVIALSEETLQVGKREIDRGTTRVRRFVVERPVEEQVRLRDERVSVVRRPVTASTSASVDAGAFSERIVEVTQTDEEAVVGKTAHVVEEVVVRKGVDERLETIKETLRHEEVDIETPASRKI